MKMVNQIIDYDQAKDFVENKRKKGGFFGKEEKIVFFDKVLYPTFNITYSYFQKEGFIKKNNVQKKVSFIEDGLLNISNYCSLIHSNCIHLKYINGISTPIDIDPDNVEGVRLKPNQTESDMFDYFNTAKNLMNEEIDKGRSNINRNMNSLEYDMIDSDVDSKYGLYASDRYYGHKIKQVQMKQKNELGKSYDNYNKSYHDTFKMIINLPKNIDLNNLGKIENVETILIPFWVAIYDNQNNRRFHSFKDSKKDLDWLSKTISENNMVLNQLINH